MPYHSSKLFSYDHDTNTFTVWVSELGRTPFGPIFNDAIDDGFSIVSAKTGLAPDFYVVLSEKDGEHELVAWHLEPTADTVRLFPLLKNTKVVVFND